jgi:hypothetical protein
MSKICDETCDKCTLAFELCAYGNSCTSSQDNGCVHEEISLLVRTPRDIGVCPCLTAYVRYYIFVPFLNTGMGLRNLLGCFCLIPCCLLNGFGQGECYNEMNVCVACQPFLQVYWRSDCFCCCCKGGCCEQQCSCFSQQPKSNLQKSSLVVIQPQPVVIVSNVRLSVLERYITFNNNTKTYVVDDEVCPPYDHSHSMA